MPVTRYRSAGIERQAYSCGAVLYYTLTLLLLLLPGRRRVRRSPRACDKRQGRGLCFTSDVDSHSLRSATQEAVLAKATVQDRTAAVAGGLVFARRQLSTRYAQPRATDESDSCVKESPNTPACCCCGYEGYGGGLFCPPDPSYGLYAIAATKYVSVGSDRAASIYSSVYVQSRCCEVRASLPCW